MEDKNKILTDIRQSTLNSIWFILKSNDVELLYVDFLSMDGRKILKIEKFIYYGYNVTMENEKGKVVCLPLDQMNLIDLTVMYTKLQDLVRQFNS